MFLRARNSIVFMHIWPRLQSMNERGKWMSKIATATQIKPNQFKSYSTPTYFNFDCSALNWNRASTSEFPYFRRSSSEIFWFFSLFSLICLFICFLFVYILIRIFTLSIVFEKIVVRTDSSDSKLCNRFQSVWLKKCTYSTSYMTRHFLQLFTMLICISIKYAFVSQLLNECLLTHWPNYYDNISLTFRYAYMLFPCHLLKWLQLQIQYN